MYRNIIIVVLPDPEPDFSYQSDGTMKKVTHYNMTAALINTRSYIIEVDHYDRKN
jgi:hypothetical protein